MANVRSAFVCSLLLLFSGLAASGQERCTGENIFRSPSCIGDLVSSDERALFDAVNKYRTDNGLQSLKMSASLSLLGNRRMLDLQQNMRVLTHSWSNCPYSLNDQKTWPCLLESPKRLKTGYNGEGYETLYRTSKPAVNIEEAISAWKKSSLHSSIILNKGVFADKPWEEFGVAIDGQFAALWFGYSKTRIAAATVGTGIGVTFEQATAGLGKSLSISETTSTPTISTWHGFAPDRKLRLDIAGKRSDISNAEIIVTTIDGISLDASKRAVILTLLRNIFPEWPDAGEWLETSIRQIADNRSAWRRKAVRGIPVEMRADGAAGIQLRINSPVLRAPVEMD